MLLCLFFQFREFNRNTLPGSTPARDKQITSVSAQRQQTLQCHAQTNMLTKGSLDTTNIDSTQSVGKLYFTQQTLTYGCVTDVETEVFMGKSHRKVETLPY